jgi:membrane protease subunit (stomatin/prohibitin family)
MTMRDFLAGELVDIIEWTDESGGTMSWRFSRPRNEIKNGAQLVVRPGQVAILVDQGQIADLFSPGRYELSTSNMPLLSSIRGWKYGFASPFKADVVFLSTTQFVGRKWGTSNPVILRDPTLGAVRLRAFGTYAVRITDARKFVQELVGANAIFSLDQITDQLRDMVVAKVSGVLASGGISVYELSARYSELGGRVQEQLAAQFEQYGLTVAQLVIENVSLPPEVEATIDQKTRMSMLSGDMDQYTRLQSADAIRDAARNPGGGAAAVVGMGIGATIGQATRQAAPAPSVGAFEPPPLPAAVWYYVVNGERQGPVDEAELRRVVTTAATLVWKQGMSNWTAAGEVPALAASFPPRAG